MYAFLPSLSWLPLIELIGFIVIGGKIGFLASLLWLMASTALGFWLLREWGMKALMRTAEDEDGFFAEQSAFDSLCMLIAALLLILPGFISDFLAVPFILAPFRHWLFALSRRDGSFMRRFTRKSRDFRQWTYTRTSQTQDGTTRQTRTTTIIDGEYKRLDDRIDDQTGRPK